MDSSSTAAADVAFRRDSEEAGNLTVSQDPSFQLQAYLRYQVSQATSVSFGYSGTFGGESFVNDGQRAADALRPAPALRQYVRHADRADPRHDRNGYPRRRRLQAGPRRPDPTADRLLIPETLQGASAARAVRTRDPAHPVPGHPARRLQFHIIKPIASSGILGKLRFGKSVGRRVCGGSQPWTIGVAPIQCIRSRWP